MSDSVQRSPREQEAASKADEGTSRVLAAAGRAFALAGRGFVPLAVLALGLALPDVLLRDWAFHAFLRAVTGWLPAHGVLISDPQQASILALTLADLPGLAWDCLAGSFAAAAVVHLYLRASRGRPLSLGGLLADAAGSWRRVLWPYTAASLLIYLGSIVVIPGILYTLFYAFVVPVAVLDPKARRVLSRSQKLSRGYRGRIFRLYLLFLPWWGWYSTFGPLVLMDQPRWVQVAASTVDQFLGFVIALALLQFYLARMAQLRARLAERAQEA